MGEQEAKLKEEKRLSLAKAKKEQDNRAEAQRLRDEERKAVEGQREKARMEEEERRRREMERLQNMKNKQQQDMMVRQKQEVSSSTNVELKYYGTAEQRPGDQHGFGFGNVQTGQVSTRKMTFLTRSSSAGPEDRAGLNPDLIVRTTSSARASPMPFAQPEFTTAPSMPVSGGGMKMMSAEEAAAATKTAAMQWSQQSSAIAKTDFASSTKALGTGLARRSPAPPAPVSFGQTTSGMSKMEGFTQMSSSSSTSSSAVTTNKQISSTSQVQFSSSMKQSSTSSFSSSSEGKVKKISFKG